MNDDYIKICNWCGQPSDVIWVHGHGQCSVCKIVIDECCKGEEARQLIPSGDEKEKSEDD